MSKPLEHFVDLARIGRRNPGASSGEKRAWRLAERVLDDLPGLDEDAVFGLIEFIHTVYRQPGSAGDLLE